MTKINNSTFSFTISDMADFWHIDGAVLSSLKELKLNFIAKSGSDQTDDLEMCIRDSRSRAATSDLAPLTKEKNFFIFFVTLLLDNLDYDGSLAGDVGAKDV